MDHESGTKLALRTDQRSRYLKTKIANVDGSDFSLESMELIFIPGPERRRENLSFGKRGAGKLSLPVVRTKAVEFEDRCKKSGLRQNAMHFEFSDTGTIASVLHVFGETSVSIYSPFSTETQEQRDSEEQIAIWIRTFDHAIRFSYNGMFFLTMNT